MELALGITQLIATVVLGVASWILASASVKAQRAANSLSDRSTKANVLMAQVSALQARKEYTARKPLLTFRIPQKGIESDGEAWRVTIEVHNSGGGPAVNCEIEFEPVTSEYGSALPFRMEPVPQPYSIRHDEALELNFSFELAGFFITPPYETVPDQEARGTRVASSLVGELRVCCRDAFDVPMRFSASIIAIHDNESKSSPLRLVVREPKGLNDFPPDVSFTEQAMKELRSSVSERRD